MVVTWAGGGKIEIITEGQRVEKVKKCKHLGSVISEDGRCIEDVKQGIGMATDAFNKKKDLLTKSMSKNIRKRMVKTLVWPAATYGCETRIMRKEERDRLEAFEMWCWRRMEKVSWKDKKTNEEVLNSVGEERSFVGIVLKRKKNWIGNIVRGNRLLKQVIEGRMEGRRPRGRPRMGCWMS